MTLAFMLGNFGLGEIGIIVVILLLLFGAKRIPQMARALGSSIGEFKRGRKEGKAVEPHIRPPNSVSHTADTKELADGRGTPRGQA
jgi:sec-independent protein translocase protein TatA